MGLLDFPLDIIQRIIYESVLEVGVSKSWRYRSVCRKFSLSGFLSSRYASIALMNQN